MKVDIIVTVFRLLATAKLNKLTSPNKVALLKAFKQIKDISTPVEDLLTTGKDKLKPEGFDELSKKESRTNEEEAKYQELLREYTDSLNEVIKEEVNKEADLTFEKISEEAYQQLLDSNEEFNFAQCDLLNSVLC